LVRATTPKWDGSGSHSFTITIDDEDPGNIYIGLVNSLVNLNGGSTAFPDGINTGVYLRPMGAGVPAEIWDQGVLAHNDEPPITTGDVITVTVFTGISDAISWSVNGSPISGAGQHYGPEKTVWPAVGFKQGGSAQVTANFTGWPGYEGQLLPVPTQTATGAVSSAARDAAASQTLTAPAQTATSAVQVAANVANQPVATTWNPSDRTISPDGLTFSNGNLTLAPTQINQFVRATSHKRRNTGTVSYTVTLNDDDPGNIYIGIANRLVDPNAGAAAFPDGLGGVFYRPMGAGVPSELWRNGVPEYDDLSAATTGDVITVTVNSDSPNITFQVNGGTPHAIFITSIIANQDHLVWPAVGFKVAGSAQLTANFTGWPGYTEQVLALPTQTSTGTISDAARDATTTQTTQLPAQTATSAVHVSGSAAQTTPTDSIKIVTAAVHISGQTSPTLALPTQTTAGNISGADIQGTVTQVSVVPAQTATAAVRVSASVTQTNTVPAQTALAAGSTNNRAIIQAINIEVTVAQPDASASQTLPAPIQVARGWRVDAINITWLTPPTDPTPDFLVDWGTTDFIIGDIIHRLVDDNPSFTSPDDVTHTIISDDLDEGDDSIIDISFTLSEGTHYVKILVERNGDIIGVSDTESITLTSGGVVAVQTTQLPTQTFTGAVRVSNAVTQSTAILSQTSTASLRVSASATQETALPTQVTSSSNYTTAVATQTIDVPSQTLTAAVRNDAAVTQSTVIPAQVSTVGVAIGAVVTQATINLVQVASAGPRITASVISTLDVPAQVTSSTLHISGAVTQTTVLYSQTFTGTVEAIPGTLSAANLLAVPLQTSTGAVRVSASFAQTLDTPLTSTTATIQVSVSSTNTLSVPTQTATGEHAASGAIAAQTTTLPTQTATSGVQVSATVGQTTSAPISSGVGGGQVDAVHVSTLAVPVSDASISIHVTATADNTLAVPQGSGEAEHAAAGIVATNILALPIQVAEATSAIEAFVAKTLPPLASVASAQILVSAQVSRTLAVPVQSVAANIENPIALIPNWVQVTGVWQSYNIIGHWQYYNI
jgi:hypothetical protein